ncbi:alpha-ketoglutarate-dependent dioxygenase AlkB [Pseudomonas sp. yb_1]|uniref:alpha-ketoglutarate-dependent dioxygenase AlkB n=1 Tax=Pseudomonas sp. yb_1 TaxID=3367217 RepID=UPI00370B20F9
MKSYPGTQLDFLDNPAQKERSLQDRAQVVIELDHRAWMRFLIDEWLFPDGSGKILLGVERACESYIPPDLMTVAVWFDQAKLPPINITVWRRGAWSTVALSDIGPNDTVISWDAPLPLFAVDHFTVQTSETRAHLLAMVRNFADIDPPSQSVEVRQVDKVVVPPGGSPLSSSNRPPENWDALRGAAAMAFWAVPAIGPWLEVLCESLSSEKPTETAEAVHASWLRFALWSGEAQPSAQFPILWHAIVSELSRPASLKEWRPRALLDAVCSRARLLGDSEERLDRLRDTTMMLLQDRGTIQHIGVKDDLLGLVFQLVLLRPSPERFAGWKEDWPAIPPAAWWTGAILTGYISGFRALPRSFRGSLGARKFLALRTWKLSGAGCSNGWSALSQDSMTWAVENDTVVLRAGRDILAEHKFSNRGRWYQVNLNDPLYADEAKNLAQQLCPDRLRQTLTLDQGSYQLLGNGQATLDATQMKLSVKGRLEIAFGPNASLESRLDVADFRDWLATASMSHRLPRPPASNVAEQVINVSATNPASTVKVKKRTAVEDSASQTKPSLVKPPKGLLIAPNFITPDEESALIESIDALPWDSTMTRRVQHYGWRYDYKTRKVNPNSYIGPLPEWASKMGERLLSQGFLLERPDQVIVNEYIGQQGIAKHIDCLPCFRGAIVTISLNESWEMVFSRQTKSGTDEKYKVLLERRSAAVLDGEARKSWLHEIPRKIREVGGPRGRRLSITFRKVDTKH